MESFLIGLQAKKLVAPLVVVFNAAAAAATVELISLLAALIERVVSRV